MNETRLILAPRFSECLQLSFTQSPAYHSNPSMAFAANVKKILVVGGNGFIGSAVCRAALAKGLEVTSVSSSGNPYRTPKGHSPSWTSKVDWQQGDALNPATFSHLFEGVGGVVHTLGTLLEDGAYKKAIREGNLPELVKSFLGTSRESNPLRRTASTGAKGSYENLNRDAALRVCEAFIASPQTHTNITNVPRPFVYVSAEDIFRPVVPARYIETKREAEEGIEEMMRTNPDFRGVYIRPSLVYHAHLRPLTTPIATALDISATFHRKLPTGFPAPSSILRSLGSSSQPGGGVSAFDSIANALTLPPIHVDQVAAAIVASLDSANGVQGIVGVNRMRELIGWRSEEDSAAAQSGPIQIL
ncbi:mitochondrial protein [Coprinopsis sp. MPI-PUGE-AT-0042]|nr:mitochondrial protein [Coprinopsis sp. MPI-PUGE-AT-0042]